MLVGASLNGAVRNGPSLKVSAFPPAFTGARSWTQKYLQFLLELGRMCPGILQYVHLPALNYAADHLASQTLTLEVPLQLLLLVFSFTPNW